MGFIADTQNDSLLLMCKDCPVFNITLQTILNEKLIPGAILNKNLSYVEWMKTRYSLKSNTSARRLMLRAFQSENHDITLSRTYALNLSDCYWIKEESNLQRFEDVTPYIHQEWSGDSKYIKGSISTLFTNGASSKRWDSKEWLRKYNSFKEFEVYRLARLLDLNIPDFTLDGEDLLIKNFTSVDVFLESFEQAGELINNDHYLDRGIKIFGEDFVKLLVLDYLVEHDDRHPGNFGFIRDSNTGHRLGLSPFYDFDWCFSGWSNPLPSSAYNYRDTISKLCNRALEVPSSFKDMDVIIKRANELLDS